MVEEPTLAQLAAQAARAAYTATQAAAERRPGDPYRAEQLETAAAWAAATHALTAAASITPDPGPDAD